MTCHAFSGAIVCDGRGKTRKKRIKGCPHCWLEGMRPRLSLVTEIYDGYVAPDIVCGNCGQEWTPGERAPRIGDRRRRENMRRVRAVLR